MTTGNEALATYLQDHLAGAAHALDLLEHMRKQHASDPIGEFARAMFVEVSIDRDMLAELSGRIGAGSSGLKVVVSRFGEKISWLKLNDHGAVSFETFEALEFLVLGIRGKRALWRALAVAQESDPRLQVMDYSRLEVRAAKQERLAEEQRIALAETALRPGDRRDFGPIGVTETA
jgi:hypothetical protein